MIEVLWKIYKMYYKILIMIIKIIIIVIVIITKIRIKKKNGINLIQAYKDLNIQNILNYFTINCSKIK